MKTLRFGVLSVSILAWSLLSLTGCKNDNPNQPQASPSGTPVAMFEGEALPAGATSFKATPFFNSSPELTQLHPEEGPIYIVLSPRNPQNALLVIEPKSQAEDIAERPSAICEFRGESVGVTSPTLVEHVKTTYGLDLQLNERGEIDALKLSQPPSDENKSGERK